MLIDDYINYTKKYSKIYDKFLILMQVGSFYELYGFENEGTDVDKICELLDIQSTCKNKSKGAICRTNPKMAGIPLYVLDKYLDILMENGYAVVLVEQVTPPPDCKREVTRIVTPATRDNENSIENNYLMCVYFTVGSDKDRKFLLSSVSYVDVNTNHSYIFETTQPDTQMNIEDVYKTIKNNRPSEIIIFTDIQTKKHDNFIKIIKEFTNRLQVSCIHNKIDHNINENYFKLSYQKIVLNKVFKNTGLLSIVEYLDLENYPLSIVCYTYLIQFIYEHNEKIIEGLIKPVFLKTNKYLKLINNVVSNLNIISNGSNTKTSSILNLLNNCKTAMGKRYFKNSLLNPSTDIENINKSYDMCEYYMTNNFYKECRDILLNINDLEKLFKRIILKTIQPYQFVLIYDSFISILELIKINNDNLENLNWNTGSDKEINNLLTECKETFNIEELRQNQNPSYIFNKNVYPDLDDVVKEINILQNIFENVCLCLNEGNENNNEFKIEIKSKNKDTIRMITITINRYETMLKDKKRCNIINKLLKEKCNLTLEDIEVKPATANNKNMYKIVFKGMDKSQIKLIELQNTLKEKISEKYNNKLTHIYESYTNIFNIVTGFVAKVDYYSNNAFNAVDKSYTRPIIMKSDNSYIKAEKVRHPLIEVINTDIPYVANDIEIGLENKKGMLLYGLNSVGKSSYMKSIGINLILAQAGMYVASKSFEYYPYDEIFTRIPSGDDLFKGQSTFVAEVNELRTIIKRSTERSLVIGDELCSGTENVSAISLVASGVNYLSNRNCSFIFASHLHELCELETIKQLKNVNIFHLSVEFDKLNNCLVFDRILKEGNGSVLYGLEIAKSLDLPADFLYTANQIRQDFMDMKKNIVEQKKSTYSSSVFMDECSICKQKCTEVHHISEQRIADKNGNIEEEQIHKNRKSNLLPVCEECHQKIHNNNIKVEGYKQTSEGVKLEIKEVKNKIDEDILKNKCIELRNKGLSYEKIFKNIQTEFDNTITLYKVKKMLK